MAERTIKTFMSLLRLANGGDVFSTNWPSLIPGVLTAYRHTPHSSTGYSPFYLEHGRNMNLPVDSTFNTTTSEDYEQYVSKLQESLKEANEKSKSEILHQQNRRNKLLTVSQPPVKFNTNDLVWYNLDQRVGSTKFYFAWHGPAIVEKSYSAQFFLIRDLSSKKTFKINIRRLRLYRQGWKAPPIQSDTTLYLPALSTTPDTVVDARPPAQNQPFIPLDDPIDPIDQNDDEYLTRLKTIIKDSILNASNRGLFTSIELAINPHFRCKQKYDKMITDIKLLPTLISRKNRAIEFVDELSAEDLKSEPSQNLRTRSIFSVGRV